MRIDHIAIWVRDIENMKAFYEKYFQGKAGEKYLNHKKGFQSYFISFSDGCRLELMQKESIPDNKNSVKEEYIGLIHFAISVGSKVLVDDLTEELRKNNFEVVGEPRTTGDGYYESVILDPENNRIEITV